jgi:hypothetical protein
MQIERTIDTARYVHHYVMPGEAGPIDVMHSMDEHGNPTGGASSGVGFAIAWQDGPRTPDEAGRLTQASGAFVEDILLVAADRLEFFQESRFACEENAEALAAVRHALSQLEARRGRRRADGTEGRHATGQGELEYSGE